MTTSQPMDGAAPDLPAPAATRPKEPGIDAVARAAVQQNIPTRRLLSSPYLQLGHGRNRSRFGAHMSSSTAFIATQLTIDKALTSFLLTAAGIPVPDGSTVTSMEEAVEVARHIGYPVVCKPTDSNRSLGVFTNIQDESTLREWFPDTLTESPSATAVIQQHVTGSDYRVLTIGNSIAAIFKRIPAFVVGNGSSTIGELIDIENQTPEDNPTPRSISTRSGSTI